MLQSKTITVLSTFTESDVQINEPNRLGERTAELFNEDDTYKNEIKITTHENSKKIESLEQELKSNKKLQKEQKKDLTKQLKELQDNAIETVVSQLTSTRFIDIFHLLLTKMAIAKTVVNSQTLTLDTINGTHTRFTLGINEVCQMLGIEYRTAFDLLEQTGESLKRITIKYDNKKQKNSLIKGWFVILQSYELRNNVFTFEFSNKFALLMLKTGNIRPTLADAYKYDAREYKYMGRLRYKLESDFFTSKLNAGQIKRIRLSNLVGLFNGDISKNPKRILDLLRIHLSALQNTDCFKCAFTLSKGEPLPAEYIDYLELASDGTLKENEELDEIKIFSNRIKVKELLNNVMLSYTFLKRPEFKLTNKTKSGRPSKKKTTAKKTATRRKPKK
jgi:hypothetical protein